MDYKVILALGAIVFSVVFVVKADSETIGEVLIHGIDAVKEYAIVSNSIA